MGVLIEAYTLQPTHFPNPASLPRTIQELDHDN